VTIVYLHCKTGFFEVDRWDGSPVGREDHQAAIDELRAGGAVEIAVVRCRDRAQLRDLLKHFAPRQARIWKSPPRWDYPFRVYLTLAEWASTMASVAAGLDYRNFKSWTKANAPAQAALAYDIWGVAERAGRADRFGWDESDFASGGVRIE